MSIARLKITLDHVKPEPLRRIEVPLDMTLADLHLVIQAAMPWENYHLYEFRIRQARWGIPDADMSSYDDPPDASKVTLRSVLDDTRARSLKYVYDFGDDWEHTIKVEKIVEPEDGRIYPRLVDATGRCPPEDVGGPWGYEHYLAVIADPSHEQHKELVAWRGPGFDPTTVDIDDIMRQVAALARKPSRSRTVRGTPKTKRSRSK